MFGIVIPVFIVIIAIVVGIVLLTRSKSGEQSGGDGASVTRRVWMYLISFVSLLVFSIGVGQLLTLIFDVTVKSPYVIGNGSGSYDQQQLALGLAMTLIGGPLWLLFWRSIQHRAKNIEYETGSAIRKFFLNLIILVTALFGIFAFSDFLRWLISGVSTNVFPSDSLAVVIVTGIVWFYHWTISEKEGHPSEAASTLRRWYVYVLSATALIWLTTSIVGLINAGVSSLPVWGNTIVQAKFWGYDAQISVVSILVAGITWYFHWFRMAKGDYDSTLRKVYYYVFTIPGGAIAALAAVTVLLFNVFAWAFGNISVAGGSDFKFTGWAIPTILLGIAIWGYHRQRAQEEAGTVAGKRNTAQRIYLYLMSFIGLGMLVAGLSILLGLLLDLIINAAGSSIVSTSGWWREQLSICLALLLAGVPLWLYFWNRVMRRMQTDDVNEWHSLSRRIFLYVVVGISILAIIGDMVNIIYQLLSGGFTGDFNIDVLRDSKWSLQTLIVAVPVLLYHWRILRADQRKGAESVIIRRNVMLLTDNRSGELVEKIQDKINAKIRTVYRAGEVSELPSELSDEDIDRISSEIQSSPSNKIILIISDGKATVYPYQDK